MFYKSFSLCLIAIFTLCISLNGFATQSTIKTTQSFVTESTNQLKTIPKLNKHLLPKDTLIKQAVVKQIDDFLTATGVTGGLLIAEKGKVILRKGYGWADEKQKIPMTTSTVFDIGSVTKQFTTTGILKLEEQGKLKLTDTLPKFFNSVPEDKQDITIHQLLTHTSGFEHDVEGPKEFPARDDSVRAALDSKLKFKPGEKWSYSNAGYMLLAAIIDTISGTSYENYLRENLWKPAGMLKTGFFLPNFSKAELAIGYDISGELGISQDLWWDKNGPIWYGRGGGYILSTLEDLYKWDLALKGNKILSEESKKRLYAPYAQFKDRKEDVFLPFKDGKAPKDHEESWNYGYGWAIFKTPRGTRLIEHTGSNSIVSTDFLRYIDEDVTIIFFTTERHTQSLKLLSSVVYSNLNSADNTTPLKPFRDQLINFPKPEIKLTHAELGKYAGTYQLPSGDKFDLELNQDQLQVRTLTPGVAKLLTTFPKLADSERLANLEARTGNITAAIARGDLESVRDLIYIESTLDEEKAYWKRTFAEWNKRFGAFKKSEVVGTTQDKENLDTFVLFEFERGTTIVLFRQSTDKKFYIGTAVSLLPRYYRLIPKSRSEFVVYNHSLQTNTPINFTLENKGEITGITFQNQSYLVKKSAHEASGKNHAETKNSYRLISIGDNVPDKKLIDQQSNLSPELKNKILKEISKAIDKQAYVYGVDFTRWKTVAAAHKAEFDRAQTNDEFAHAMNTAFNEFGVSHLDLRTPEAAAQRQSGKSTRAGISGGQTAKGYEIYTVRAGSPAEAAGLQAGDIIVSVDGKPLEGALAGQPGQGLKIQINRDGKPLEINLEIKEWPLAPDALSWLDDKTAMIAVRSFSDSHYDAQLIENLFSEVKNAQTVVLDIRGNGGGNADNVMHLLSMILPKQTLLGTFVEKADLRRFQKKMRREPKDLDELVKFGEMTISARNKRNVTPYSGRIIVVSDRSNGSGAEIFARGIQDLKRGMVAGDGRTYGAVLLGDTVKLSGKFELHIVTADYVTVAGKRIEGNGVEPDIKFASKIIGNSDALKKEILKISANDKFK